MNNPIFDQDPLLVQLRQLIARKFRLGEGGTANFSPDEPLIGGRLGLDSLDALELGMCIEEEFGVTIGSAADSRNAFATLASLTCFIRRQASKLPAAGPAAAALSPLILTPAAPRLSAGV